jgi:ketosteroid isomerase-like protein
MRAALARAPVALRFLLLFCLLVAAMPASAADPDTLRRQVDAAERLFARSMAERDLAAFERHLSEGAVFYGGAAPLVGRAAVVAGWKRFFEGPQPPFSWEPDRVDVLADGTLAHSSGPVRDPSGQVVARFNSVWRQEAPGVWRVVFDKGAPLSDAERAAAGRKP